MNTELSTKAKNNFSEDFFKVINNSFFGKTKLSLRKHRHMKLVASARRSMSVSKPNCHTAKWFSGKLFIIKINKTEGKMNKRVYSGLPILHVCKTGRYEYWLNIIKKIKFDDDVPGENRQEHNQHWLQIPDHPCKIRIICDSESRKTNALITLIHHQQTVIDKTYTPKISMKESINL